MKKFWVCLCSIVLVCILGVTTLIFAGADNRDVKDSQDGKYIFLSGGLDGKEDVQITRDYILDYMGRDFNSITSGLILSLKGLNGDIWRPKEIPITFQSRIYGQKAKYSVNLSLTEDFSSFATYDGEDDYPNQSKGSDECIFVSNLMVGKKYYYRIVGETENGETYYSKVGTFTTQSTPARWVNWGIVSNSRDVGGWQTMDGKRVKQGMIYRSGRVQETNGMPIIDESVQNYIVNTFGIKTDVDFRGLYDDALTTMESLYGKLELISVPIHAYATMFENEIDRVNLKTIFSVFADESKYPMYYHCSAGADRTGMVTFFLNGLLGVEWENLIKDYELTSFSDQTLRYRGSDMLSVSAVLLEYGKDAGVQNINQAIEFWLKDYVGVTEAEIAKIKEIMLESEVC